MRIIGEESGLKSQFQTTQSLGEFTHEAQVLTFPARGGDAPASQPATPYAKNSQEGDLRGIQVLMDMGTAAEVGGGLRGVDGVTAVKQNQEREEKKRKREQQDQELRALLDQIGALDAEIDGLQRQIDALKDKIDRLNETAQALLDGDIDVDEALARPEVADAVREWEKRTGRKFDKDSENSQDVLVAILGSQADRFSNEVGALKAQKSILEVERDGLVDRVREWDARAADELDTVRTEVRAEADASYAKAQGIGALSATAEFVADASDSQDDLSDAPIDSDESISMNADGFGAFDGPPSEKLASNSAVFGSQFKTASAETGSPVEQDRTVEVKLDLTAKV
ncbi:MULTISPECIES: hypothetical protein [Actibacterium]|uniref:Regulator of replication initiation timing n=1 Tax=Actibacterium naphthalenivorans TaxID=1614693 RepID=A0A840CIC9_9RHOB|nr:MULTISPECIES: hypothetical protein [Actibacterium]ALG91170.1 hypothetical protein TQ29_14460 [Actibacterium sp. EMB200-NS6]MBB4022526.1 regulator of replication initiation timing [Actibacterium naphthalenivorans]